MKQPSHLPISVITAMPDSGGERALFAFTRAWALGTFAAAAPAALLFVPPFLVALLGNGGFDPQGLTLLVIPLLVSGSVTLVGMVVIGLPLTKILARRGSECPMTYAACGAGAGAILPLAVCLALGSWEAGFFFAVFGMLAGFTTALSWGRWRMALRHNPTPRENPFHDMIY